MAQKNVAPKRLRVGDNTLSAGTWNGLVQDYEDRRRTTNVTGDPLHRPVPPMLRGSTIVLASLREGEESISGFQPVRISKINRGKDLAYALPYYEVQAVDSTVGGDLDGYERAYQYGFTMGEGVSEGAGGRVVIAGTAIVSIPADKFMRYATGTLNGFPSNSMYYVVNDETLMPSDYYMPLAPVGHFRTLGYISDSNDELERLTISDWSEGRDEVFMAIDMSPVSQTFMVNLGSLYIAPPDYASSDFSVTSSEVGTVYSTYWFQNHWTDPMENLYIAENPTDGEQVFVRVYNPTQHPAVGIVQVQFSEVYNRFVVVGTQSSFQVELEQVGGSQGDSTTAASWTYNVKLWEGDGSILKASAEIAGGDNHYRRPNAGQLEPATYGTATYNSTGGLVIIDCNETFIFTTC